ncbi:MAG: hypothetical protein IK005_00185 [Paludibacteraceae bacterium]|nr:hypothetical protein [Paludibacteraceae bacterium]
MKKNIILGLFLISLLSACNSINKSNASKDQTEKLSQSDELKKRILSRTIFDKEGKEVSRTTITYDGSNYTSITYEGDLAVTKTECDSTDSKKTINAYNLVNGSWALINKTIVEYKEDTILKNTLLDPDGKILRITTYTYDGEHWKMTSYLDGKPVNETVRNYYEQNQEETISLSQNFSDSWTLTSIIINKYDKKRKHILNTTQLHNQHPQYNTSIDYTYDGENYTSIAYDNDKHPMLKTECTKTDLTETLTNYYQKEGSWVMGGKTVTTYELIRK